MTEAALILPRTLVQDLFHQAQLSPKTEICGLVSAVDGEARACYPVTNVSGDPEHLFDLDAQGQIDALRRMREKGEHLFAIYHSHPSAPPVPSDRDHERIAYPDAYYLIISLNIKGVLELRAWKAATDSMQEVPLKIIRN